ncbi:MAG: DUF3987 domain-containing protein [Thiothrix sp.]|nr:MAG: DUF3987 domain-containing protein [Thiothrix sp.]
MSKPAKVISLDHAKLQRGYVEDDQERTFIGYLLSGDNDLVIRAMGLPENVLYSERNRLIYKTAQAVFKVEKSLNITNLSKGLEDSGLLVEIGGIGYLAEITRIGHCYTLLGLASVIDHLNTTAKKRDVAELIGKLQLGLSEGWTVVRLQEEIARASDILTPSTIHQATPKNLDLMKHLPDNFWFKQYVTEVAEIAQFPVNTTLLSALSAFSAATLRRYVIEYETGGKLATGVYLMGGQPPATGKTRVLAFFIAAAMKLAKDAEKTYREELEASEDHKAKKPTLKIYSDVTPEALDGFLNDSNGFFSLVSSEQALANTLLGASYSTGKNNNDLMLKGFNAEHHASGRAKRDGFYGLVIGGITLLTQPKVIDTLLTQSDGTGAAERFLLINEPDLLGKREHRGNRRSQALGQRDYDLLVNKLLKGHTFNQPDFESLESLKLTESGYKLLNSFIRRIESELAKNGVYGSDAMRGMAGKADQQALKIAAQFHLLDTRAEEGTTIKDCWIEAAINIVDDMLGHALSLLERNGYIGTTAQEDMIIEYLASKGGKATRREIQQGKKSAKVFKEGAGNPCDLINETISGLLKNKILIEEFSKGSNGRTITRLVLAQ